MKPQKQNDWLLDLIVLTVGVIVLAHLVVIACS